jgi:pimeloyl-ACP methyl ester carboxylesterase
LVVAALVSIALLVGVAPTPAQAAVTKTSSAEKKRVDKVKTKVTWTSTCAANTKCGKITLPLDYDKPKGTKVTVKLARYRSPSQVTRLGAIFVNFGGPGSAAIAYVKSAPAYFSADILKYFDIIGVDPRGTNTSAKVKCYSTTAKQTKGLAGMTGVAIPTSAQVSAYKASAKSLAKACSSTGKSKASAMSTAEVARDMDVIRRVLGYSKMNYLGFSYGTYLGQVYASMFPDRIRTMALDGFINPVSWRGTSSTKNTPITLRIGAATGSWNALVAGLNACKAAGSKCPIKQDPLWAFQTVAARLQARTYYVAGFGNLTYSQFISYTVTNLRYYDSPERIAKIVAGLLVVTDPASSASQISSAAATIAQPLQTVRLATSTTVDPAYYAVMCTDSTNAKNQSTYVNAIALANNSAPHFGSYWGWQAMPCATAYWTAKDEDRYTKAFAAKTAYPVLAIGTTYDPVTPVSGARNVTATLTNAVFVENNGYGHLSYFNSTCIRNKVNAYFISRTLPSWGTTCSNEHPVFTK